MWHDNLLGIINYIDQYRMKISQSKLTTLHGIRKWQPSFLPHIAHCVSEHCFGYFQCAACALWELSWPDALPIVIKFLNIVWFLTGEFNSRKDKLKKWYHIWAWGTAFVLAGIIAEFVGVDGDSELNICFVGVVNKATRDRYFFMPIAACYAVGIWFLAWCTYLWLLASFRSFIFLIP